jgi:hypothetical protein
MFPCDGGVKDRPGLHAYSPSRDSCQVQTVSGSRSGELRERAAHCRALAATFTVESNRQKMRQLADDFERMATDAEGGSHTSELPIDRFESGGQIE